MRIRVSVLGFGNSRLMEPAYDMWDHWTKSNKCKHPLFGAKQVEPGVRQVFNKVNRVGDLIAHGSGA